jgi:hypothetical protein
MDSSAGNLSALPGGSDPGLEIKPAATTGAVRTNTTKPDPVRVARALAMVDEWWESRSVPVETIGGAE